MQPSSKSFWLFATALVFAFSAHAFALPLSIADTGAVGDGKTINTAAIQKAVDRCAAKGGGTVSVPAGVWVTGSIELKSHVTLQLEAGATLRGSTNLADYPPNGFKHPEMGETTSLLWAIHQEDISICGEGTIDLVDRTFFDWNRINSGLPPEKEALLNDTQRSQCVVTVLHRPDQPIFFHDCRHLRLEHITIRNSPCWTVTVSCCQDVFVHELLIDNNFQVPNNDGMHFSGSKNIVVSDCIIRGGDDALAFTAITDANSICENILVTNCILTSRSAAVRLGFNHGKVRNATLTNLVIKDSNRGFIIQAGDDGWVENVAISNVVIEAKIFAGGWWGKGEPFVISAANTESGHIRGVSISHLRAQAENSVLIVGHNHNVRDVVLDDLQITLKNSPNAALYGMTYDIAPAPPRPSFLNTNRLPWLYADEVSGLVLRNITFQQGDPEVHPLSLEPVLTNIDRLKDPAP